MTIVAAGIDIDYRLEGPAGAPVVTLIHSLATHLGAWDPVAADLATDFRVLRYSLRGHGATTATPGPYSLAMLSDDLAHLLDALAIERTDLVGLSIGGMIAQRFALDHADRLRRLIICSSISELPEGSDALWDARIEAVETAGLAGQVEATIERWFSADFSDAEPAVLDGVRAMIEGTSLDGYVGCCDAIKAMHLTPHIEAVRAPTLVMVGGEDPGTPPAAAEIIANAIPTARLHVVDGVSHQMALQRPTVFCKTVRDFLAGDVGSA